MQIKYNLQIMIDCQYDRSISVTVMPIVNATQET